MVGAYNSEGVNGVVFCVNGDPTGGAMCHLRTLTWQPYFSCAYGELTQRQNGDF